MDGLIQRTGVDRETFYIQLDLLHRALWGWPIDRLTPFDELMVQPTIEDAARLLLGSERFRWDNRGKIPLWPKTKWVCTEAFGLKFWVDLHDSHVGWGVLHESWENDEVRFLTDRLQPGNAMLDIGANIGVYTMQAAQKVGAAGRIYSVEPRPDTARHLKRSIDDNGFAERCTVFNVAVGDETSRGTMGGDRNNPGASFVRADREGGVSIVRVDDLPIDADLTIKFVKIDIEGYEPLMMRGATEFFSRHRPLVLAELFPRALREVGGSTSAEYLSQWHALGYGAYRLEGGTIGSELTIGDLPAMEHIADPFNVVCMPR